MYIGLDLGTSGLKGILIDEEQRVLAEAVAPLAVSRPHKGWSEQSPADWIAAAEAVMDQLAAHGLSDVKGIGLSGQMHGATLLDASDEVLRPCILWNDTRSHAEAAALDATRASGPSRATSSFRASRRRSSSGSSGTSRRSASGWPRCFCPRTICGSG